jgi:6,7-dimethyl-8-ribityllumazine synthase
MELPLPATKLFSQKHHVIIALGVVIKGKTAHFEHVCHTATEGCLRVSLDTKLLLLMVFLRLITLNKQKSGFLIKNEQGP